MGRRTDTVVINAARRQHGVVSRRQLLEAGVTDRMIHSRLRSGFLVPLASGVYALRTHPHDWLQRLQAATLAHAGAVASHRSAAALHGLHGFGRGRHEITVPEGANHRSELVTVHESRLELHVGRIDGIPVTTVAQTLADLAGHVATKRLAGALDEAVAAGRTTTDEIGERVVAITAPRRIGFRQIAAVLAVRAREAWVPPMSELERHLHHALNHPDIPPWTAQAPAPWAAGGRQCVDAFIEGWRLIVEADGRRWHTRVEDFARDRERDHRAVAAGLRVVRFAWEHLVRGPAYAQHILLAAGSNV